MIQETARRLGLGGLALAVATFSVQQAQGYSFNQVVPDVRQPASLSGGSACPVSAHRPTSRERVAVQWNTAFGTNPVAFLEQDMDPGRMLTGHDPDKQNLRMVSVGIV